MCDALARVPSAEEHRRDNALKRDRPGYTGAGSTIFPYTTKAFVLVVTPLSDIWGDLFLSGTESNNPTATACGTDVHTRSPCVEDRGEPQRGRMHCPYSACFANNGRSCESATTFIFESDHVCWLFFFMIIQLVGSILYQAPFCP